MKILCGAGGDGVGDRPEPIRPSRTPSGRPSGLPSGRPSRGSGTEAGAGGGTRPSFNWQRVPPDPRWALTLEVAAELRASGRHVVVMDPRPVQRLVDMQWAGHQAARLLGGRARISVSAPTGDEPDVTVTITYVDPDGTGRDRAEQGMDLLLGSVRAEQAGSSGSSAPGLR